MDLNYVFKGTATSIVKSQMGVGVVTVINVLLARISLITLTQMENLRISGFMMRTLMVFYLGIMSQDVLNSVIAIKGVFNSMHFLLYLWYNQEILKGLCYGR